MTDPKSTPGPLPYGPFTVQVRRFLQKLAALTPEDEHAVVREFERVAVTPEYQAAERVLGSAIARSGRERERDALGGPLLQMLRPTAEDAASAPGADEPKSPPSASASAFRPVAEPALAALLAVLMQDVLSAELLARLYAPFDRVLPRASLQQ